MDIKKWYVGCFSPDNKLIGGKVLCRDEKDALARALYADKQNIDKVLNSGKIKICIPPWINRYYAFSE